MRYAFFIFLNIHRLDTDRSLSILNSAACVSCLERAAKSNFDVVIGSAHTLNKSTYHTIFLFFC